MGIGRGLCAVFVGVVLVVGAAGWSAAQPSDFCEFTESYVVEGTSSSGDFSLWPPGWRCVYELPSGRTVSLESGSAGRFVGLLAAELLLAMWVARYRTRLPGPVRVAWVTVLGLSVGGMGGLVGGFLFALYAGVVFGIPVAYFAERSLLRARAEPVARRAGLGGAVAAASGGLVAAILWLWGYDGVASFALAVVAVTLVAALARCGAAMRLRQR